MQGALEGSLVIFDLDGTLVDTAQDLGAAMNHAIAADGIAPTPLADVRHLVGHGARAMLLRAYALAGVAPEKVDIEARIQRFLDHYLSHIADHSAPFPGAIDEIDALRAEGAAVAICTNKREPWARRLIAALGLSEKFVAIVGPDTLGAAKPDPRPVLHCLEIAGAGRAVFVGDSDTDIAAAAAAGLPCLLAEFGYGPTERRAEAFAAFTGYAGFSALVRRAMPGPATGPFPPPRRDGACR